MPGAIEKNKKKKNERKKRNPAAFKTHHKTTAVRRPRPRRDATTKQVPRVSPSPPASVTALAISYEKTQLLQTDSTQRTD